MALIMLQKIMSCIIQMSNTGAKLITTDSTAVSIVSDTLSYDVEGAEFTAGYKMGSWNGKKTFLRFPDHIFEAGFVPLVKRALTEAGHAVSILDTREKIDISAEDIKLEGIELRDYQLDAVSELERQGRGILQCATGAGKCLGKDTPVLMYDGTIKKVQDVVAGDLLMGPDSTPRVVISTTSGESRLYKITPKKGDPYVVNDAHILSLKLTGDNGRRKTSGRKGEIVNINVEEYLAQSKTFKHVHKGWRTGVDCWEDSNLIISPYFFGVLLGDGRTSGPEVTTMDIAVRRAIISEARKFGLSVKASVNSKDCLHMRIVNERGKGNPILSELHDCGYTKGKHIPVKYKTASRASRLELLAGLIDTDGSLANGYYDIIQKREELADDIAFVARSLGFAAYKVECQKSSQHGTVGTYYRVSISGNVSEIPVRINRKKAEPRKQKKDVLVHGISVEEAGFGEYFGFEIDGDKLFLLGDFTVTHNTEIAIAATQRFGLKTLFLTHKVDLVRQTRKRYAKRLGHPVGMISEGDWLPADITVATVQTIMSHWRVKWTATGIDKKGKLKKSAVFGDTEKLAMKHAISVGFREVKSLVLERDNRASVINFLKSVEFLIVDEAHRSSADSFFRIISSCSNAYYRASLTATPLMKGSREDDLKLIACSGDVIYRITNNDLIEKGILARPSFTFIEVPTFSLEDGRLPNKKTPYPTAYKSGIVDNELRNQMVVKECERLVEKGRQTVVLVKEIKHGEALVKLIKATGIKCQWVSGSDNADVREDALKALRERRINVLIASTILDEGLDEDSISAIVLAGGGKSQISLFQRVGRAMRSRKGEDLEKFGNTAEVVDFVDTGDHRLMKHSAARYNFVRKEEGWVIEGIQRWQPEAA